MSTEASGAGSVVNFDEDSMAIDLSAVPDRSGPALLEPGVYDASVENVEYKRSARSNNPMLEWRFRTSPTEDSPRGASLYWHTVLNHPNGLSNLKGALKAIAPELDLSNFNPIDAIPDLMGRECKIRVRTRKQDDTDRNEVTTVLPPSADDGSGSLFG